MRSRIIIYLVLFLCLTACKQRNGNIEGWAFKSTIRSGWGLLGTDGNIIAPSGTYRYQPSSIVGGMYTVPDGMGGVMLYHINDPSQPVCERHFYRIGAFSEDVTIAQETVNSFLSIINKEGKTVAVLNFPQYDIVYAHNFHDGRALIASREGKYGYIDTKGNIIAPPIYDNAYDFNEDKALVCIIDENGNMGYQVINNKGDICFQIQQSNIMLDHCFSEGKLMYKELSTGHCRYFDKKGETNLFLPDKVRESYRFANGKAVYQTDSGAGIVDDKGKMVIGDVYEDMTLGDDHHYLAKRGGRWAVVDNEGKALSSFSFNRIGKFHQNGYAVAELNGHYTLMAPDGKTKGQYAMIAGDFPSDNSVSESFIRNTSIPVSAYQEEKAKTLPTEKSKPLSANAALPSKKIVPPRSVKISSDWRKISKRSPFYAEAAKVLSGKLNETDAQNREMILNYVEHLRTSYTTKDIDFLNQLFSENALIIVGHIIRTSNQRESQYLPSSQVVYNVKSKQEYLSKLKIVFKLNKQINLSFNDFHIMRHPTIPGIYGVSLRQRYASDRYSDDGYLFLLWDFRNEAEPKIHVRTWQPYNIDEHHTLSDDAVFNIRDFNLQ